MADEKWVNAAAAALEVGRKPSTIREVVRAHPNEIPSREESGVFFVELGSLRGWYAEKAKRDQEASQKRKQMLARKASKRGGAKIVAGASHDERPVFELERRSYQAMMELTLALSAERDELRRLLLAAQSQIQQLKKRT